MKCWAEFRLLPGVPEAIRALTQQGFRVIVATNQRGVALGKLTEGELCTIHEQMCELLNSAGARTDAVYYCPHERGSCHCRKPETELCFRAQRDFPDLDIRRSILIGDSMTDMEAAARLNCMRILVRGQASPLEPELAGRGIRVDYFAASLVEAVREVIRWTIRRDE